MIMEYKKDVEWDGFRAPRANRVILHCDITNAEIQSLDDFHDAIPQFSPDKIIITGLHLLENEALDFRTRMLNKVLIYMVLIVDC